MFRTCSNLPIFSAFFKMQCWLHSFQRLQCSLCVCVHFSLVVNQIQAFCGFYFKANASTWRREVEDYLSCALVACNSDLISECGELPRQPLYVFLLIPISMVMVTSSMSSWMLRREIRPQLNLQKMLSTSLVYIHRNASTSAESITEFSSVTFASGKPSQRSCKETDETSLSPLASSPSANQKHQFSNGGSQVSMTAISYISSTEDIA